LSFDVFRFHKFKKCEFLFLHLSPSFFFFLFSTFAELYKTIFMILGVVGPWQVILIVALLLLFFGGKKIPELMKGLGQGMKEFKDASKGENSSEEKKDA